MAVIFVLRSHQLSRADFPQTRTPNASAVKKPNVVVIKESSRYLVICT